MRSDCTRARSRSPMICNDFWSLYSLVRSSFPKSSTMSSGWSCKDFRHWRSRKSSYSHQSVRIDVARTNSGYRCTACVRSSRRANAQAAYVLPTPFAPSSITPYARFSLMAVSASCRSFLHAVGNDANLASLYLVGINPVFIRPSWTCSLWWFFHSTRPARPTCALVSCSDAEPRIASTSLVRG